MNKTKRIIQSIGHRPWNLPRGKWSSYQEWNRSLFLHYKTPSDILQPLIPSSLTLDTFENESWISLVAFTMQKVRPRGLPAIPAISNFHELKIRTYVTIDSKPVVFFLHISAQKHLSALIAKKLSGLPYEKSEIGRSQYEGLQMYSLINRKLPFSLKAEFLPKAPIKSKSAIDIWLTERYCLYFPEGHKLFRYEIQHAEWQLSDIDLKLLTINSNLWDIPLAKPDLIHYSEGVEVLAWGKQLVI